MQEIFREIKPEIVFLTRENPEFPAHIHDEIELIYTKCGQGTAYCDGKKYTLTDGTWFLVFPNQVHRYETCADGEYWVLIMKPSELLRYEQVFMKGVPINALCHFESGQDDGLGYLLEAAYKEYRRDGYSDVIAAYLTVVFGKLLSHFSLEKERFSQNTALNILQYCAAHYKEDLTVRSVAESLGISCSCVSHVFSARFSMSFCDYINSRRLAEAEKLLKNKNYTVTEVANLSGFPTIRTFNRAFLKKYGCSPSAYRKAFVY